MEDISLVIKGIVQPKIKVLKYFTKWLRLSSLENDVESTFV